VLRFPKRPCALAEGLMLAFQQPVEHRSPAVFAFSARGIIFLYK
jgi:hypothetical protein